MQLHDIPPLYEQVQLEPVQSACHVLPRASWHIVVVVDVPSVAALPVPKHDPAPVGLGMAGHTLSATHGLGGGRDVRGMRAKMFPIVICECGKPARVRCFNGVGTYWMECEDWR